jgi:hypothetical protein
MPCWCFRAPYPRPDALIEARAAIEVISDHMTREKRMKACRLLLIAALGMAAATPVAAQTTLNVVTAGDQNMVDYVNNYLGP